MAPPLPARASGGKASPCSAMRAVVSAREAHEALAVGQQRDRLDAARVVREAFDGGAVLDAPQLDGLSSEPESACAVGRHHDGLHGLSGGATCRLEVPHADRAVLRAAEDALAVGRRRHRPHKAGVPGAGAERLLSATPFHTLTVMSCPPLKRCAASAIAATALTPHPSCVVCPAKRAATVPSTWYNARSAPYPLLKHGPNSAHSSPPPRSPTTKRCASSAVTQCTQPTSNVRTESVPSSVHNFAVLSLAMLTKCTPPGSAATDAPSARARARNGGPSPTGALGRLPRART